VKRKRVTIYRVEQRGGRRLGPYIAAGYEHWHGPDRPDIGLEDKLYRRSWKRFCAGLHEDSWRDLIFGFASRRQLHAWFNQDELRKLRREGFVVRTYQIPASDIVRGTYQLAFWRPYWTDDDLADARYRYADEE
jgi:hypothetical protein